VVEREGKLGGVVTIAARPPARHAHAAPSGIAAAQGVPCEMPV